MPNKKKKGKKGIKTKVNNKHKQFTGDKNILTSDKLQCLEWINKHEFKIDHKKGIINATANAVRLGNLKMLKLLYKCGYECNLTITWVASTNGRLDCLIYAHERGCPWNENTIWGAVCLHQWDCLIYAHEHGCPWHEKTTVCAANNGHLDCLQYAHEHGCPWHEDDNFLGS